MVSSFGCWLSVIGFGVDARRAPPWYGVALRAGWLVSGRVVLEVVMEVVSVDLSLVSGVVEGVEVGVD
jgi:hypothetical protein